MELKPRMASLNLCTMTFGKFEFRNPPSRCARLLPACASWASKPSLRSTTPATWSSLCDSSKRSARRAVAAPRGSGRGRRRRGDSENLITLVKGMPSNAIWQMIGVGAKVNLQLTTIALAMGGNARTGIEDTLWLSKGVLADNPCDPRPRRRRQSHRTHPGHRRRDREDAPASKDQLEHFGKLCRPEFCRFPTHSAEKRGMDGARELTVNPKML